MNRRTFIEFLGKGAAYSTLLPPFISACKEKGLDQKMPFEITFEIKGINAVASDEVVLTEGLRSSILIGFNDPISDADQFGFNNDYIAFVPLSKNEAILWVNHEYIQPLFVSNYTEGAKTKEQVEKEMYHIGGSIFKIRKDHQDQWEPVLNDVLNKRVNALTNIPFNWDQTILESSSAMGTLQNCAGGTTPWGTILTCEENYQNNYGERDFNTGEVVLTKKDPGWTTFYNNPPEHYGWVVEVDPKTGEAQKHVALGRCAHECATTVELEDGRVVVYTGDDKNDQCLYKFISDKPKSLKEGTLYVANLEQGVWIPLKWSDQPVLQENFKDQTEVLIRLREAAHLVGGTPLARPEDIEIDPVTGCVLVALTNNKPKENYFGEILKVCEENDTYDSLQFTSDTFLAGGEETGFACPDNMAFDKVGNLWFTSDIGGGDMHKAPYESFKNNGLFLVPRSGRQEGKVIQVASAPFDAEFTGPCFSEDGKTLFLSVQHPGENSESLDQLTSHWPNGGEAVPKPCVITIQGDLLEKIQGLV